MGDPKKQKKSYSTPRHPWEKSRIEEEKVYLKNYGLKSNQEIWRYRSLVESFKNQAKRLSAIDSEQGEKEKKQLLTRLGSLGLLKSGAELEEVLNLTVTDLLDRRLQTIVFKKGLARSAKQSRQLITHNHIKVGEKTITSPGKILNLKEEGTVSFSVKSSFNDEMHPERVQEMPSKTKIEESKDTGKEEKKETKVDKDELKEKEAKKEEKPEKKEKQEKSQKAEKEIKDTKEENKETKKEEKTEKQEESKKEDKKQEKKEEPKPAEDKKESKEDKK